MEQERIDRINELARLAKERQLTEAEQEERAGLRKEYIASFREATRRHLDSITVLHPDGTVEKLRDKKKPQ